MMMRMEHPADLELTQPNTNPELSSNNYPMLIEELIGFPLTPVYDNFQQQAPLNFYNHDVPLHQEYAHRSEPHLEPHREAAADYTLNDPLSDYFSYPLDVSDQPMDLSEQAYGSSSPSDQLDQSQATMDFTDLMDITHANEYTLEGIASINPPELPPLPPTSRVLLPAEETQRVEEMLKKTMQSCPLTDFQKRYVLDGDFRKSPHMTCKNTKTCATCGLTFSNAARYAFHYQTHGAKENKKGAKRAFCPVENCTMSAIGFATRHSAIRHVKTVHGNVKLDCSRCGRSFTRRDGLVRHFESQVCAKSR